MSLRYDVIVVCGEEKEFKRKVERKLKRGWQLVGGIHVQYSHGQAHHVYAQAFIKEDE